MDRTKKDFRRRVDRIAADTAGARVRTALLACLATLIAGPAGSAENDVEIPAIPLQSGTPYPAPNIMFILDDSGSMVFEAMPSDTSSLDDDIFDKSYVHNTIYYNPNVTYRAWKGADGQRLTGGTTYGAVYADLSMASGDTINLGRSDSCEWVDRNGSNHRVCGGDQTFFVPKAGATDLNDPTQYDRYDIKRTSDSTVHVIKSGAEVRESWQNQDIDEHDWWYGSSGSRRDPASPSYIDVPTGTLLLQVTVATGNSSSNGDADLYLRLGDKPTLGSYDHRSTGDGNSESLTISNPTPGRWWIGVYNDDSGRGNRSVNDADILAVASSSAYATPTGRSEAEELVNFATWFSYYRTRMKVAKYAASEAFSQLGDNYRVGYDSIWNRSRDVESNAPYLWRGPAYPIATNVDNGLFKDDNRDTWFEFLHKARGYNGTPLHGALQRAGEYYESDAPWISGSEADISCRLSFAILTTDGYWNDMSGYDDVDDVDTRNGPLIQPADGTQHDAYRYTPSNPFRDPDGNGRRDTLADVAMYYWNRDLRDDLANNVPTSAADRAFWQHMTTFGISIGLRGRLDPDADLGDLKSGAKEWPNPLDREDEDRIDDLWHASVNGHGDFVSATNPDRFVNGLLAALTTISERPGSASNVTANSTSFTNDTRVYQASYTSGTWTGELTAYIATSAGVQTATPAWLASEGIPPDHEDREIWTWDASESGGTEFPTSAQVSALDASARAGSAASGQANADYIAGDRSNEAANDGLLRNRTSLLGDIVDSSPIYVTDSKALFVGANDGMLHAFDGDTGEELFAYVPGGIDLAALADLSDPRYGQTVTHKYFVDGPIAVSAKSQTPGKNYLVGALGRGGRGVFGLDVTDPENFGEDDVLWEFADDPDMGMVMGDPLVVTLNDASKTKAVIVGNGINSLDGSTTLFVLNLATGEKIAEIEAGAAGANGLFAPRGWDDDGDGTVDFVYAGDLKGNVWKFDLHGSVVGTWAVANGGDPMFEARDDEGEPQPITAGLALARNPDNQDVWVFAGTGRFLSSADLSPGGVQSIYAFVDEGKVEGRTSPSDDGELVRREITAVSTDKRVRTLEPWRNSLEAGKKGWFIDLDKPYQGERVVSGLRILGTTLIASSIVPVAGGDTCAAGGTGYINAIDAFTGTASEKAFFDINGDGVVNDDDKVTVTIDGEQVDVAAGSLDLGIGMPTRPTIIDKLLVVGGSTGQLGSVAINPQGVGARRVSWREILED